jgi:hypothetical protein
MAFDAMHGQVVLFGGFGGQNQAFLNDTWLWNGTNWTQANPANSPSPRYSSAMDYDAAQGQVVLFGGYNAYTGAVLGDTWAWNGTRWTQLIPAASPSARYNSAMAYDPAQGQLVLFGGLDAFASGYPFYNDTWVWGPPTDFGNVGIGQTATRTLTFVAQASVTFGTPQVVTAGAPNRDFTLSSTTCAGAVTAGGTCAVKVSFTPVYAGLRAGVVNLVDGSGNILSSN